MNKKSISRMQTLFLSDVDDGGAAIACRRIYKEINSLENRRCEWVVASSVNNRQGGAVNAALWPSFPGLLAYEIKRRILKTESATARALHGFNEANIHKLVNRLSPKVIYLHNIHQKASFDLLRSFPQDTFILIYLHDMWYLSGYCCYSMGCDRYTTGCKEVCPQWNKWETPTSAANEEWSRRQGFYLRNRHRIRVVAPSRWMATIAQHRFNGMIPVEYIANPVDTSVFKPVGSKRSIRKMLGFEGDKPLIICGAASMKDVRKGACYLKDAINKLRQRLGNSFTVAVFGANSEDGIIPDAVGLGAIKDERLMNLYYNAATVFVLPSLAESFGLVFIEAMAAGTPCVAFDTTACSEIVREGETGYLARLGDVDSLAEAMERAIVAGDESPMSRTCREEVLMKYDVHLIGRQHRDLIEKVLA